MELSPNDIRSFEFNTQMRGYDKNDVDNLLEQVATALETARQANHQHQTNIQTLKLELAELRKFEDTIKSAAIDARRNADTTVATAKEEAKLILSEARGEAEKEMADRTNQISSLEDQMNKLTRTKKSYFTQVRELVQSHLDMIDELAAADGNDSHSGEAIHVTDSNEVGSTESEAMIASSLPSEGSPANAVDSIAADAASEMSDSSKMLLSKALQGVLKDDNSEGTASPVDPDLARALEDYKKLGVTTPDETKSEVEVGDVAAPKPTSEMVETNALAEDIPAGFIARTEEVNHENFGNSTDRDKELANHTPMSDKSDTGKPGTDKPGADKPGADQSGTGDAEKKSPLEPNTLSTNLDEVAEKFDQEMDKAEHS